MLQVDLDRIMRNPLMSEAVWTLIGCIIFGLGWLFGNEPVIREALMFGFIFLGVILVVFGIYLVLSNTKLTND